MLHLTALKLRSSRLLNLIERFGPIHILGMKEPIESGEPQYHEPGGKGRDCALEMLSVCFR